MSPRAKSSEREQGGMRVGNAIPFAAEMLTLAEIEELRRVGREQSNFFLKAFADPKSRALRRQRRQAAVTSPQ
jgi:hypothetical protein